MITQEQIEKLKPLIQHEKFGKLLENAIENWKTIKPKKYNFGINFIYDEESDQVCYRKDINHSGCCLIGSSLIKTISKQTVPFELCMSKYNLTAEEVGGLISGFDNKNFAHESVNKDAVEFGHEVSQIVFGGS